LTIEVYERRLQGAPDLHSTTNETTDVTDALGHVQDITLFNINEHVVIPTGLDQDDRIVSICCPAVASCVSGLLWTGQ
jgi:hypothetical protein